MQKSLQQKYFFAASVNAQETWKIVRTFFISLVGENNYVLKVTYLTSKDNYKAFAKFSNTFKRFLLKTIRHLAKFPIHLRGFTGNYDRQETIKILRYKRLLLEFGKTCCNLWRSSRSFMRKYKSCVSREHKTVT